MEGQPGGATGSQPGGATGSQPGGATGSQPGGATGSQTGGATGSQPGGATGSQPGGATGSQPGGATGSQPGGATGSQPGMLTRSQSVTSSQVRVKEEKDDDFFNTHSQVRVKEENKGDSMAGHLMHRFTVSFSPDRKKYTVDCDQPRTVLEAIKSTESFNQKKKKKISDENIVLQIGKEDRAPIVPTHFPCTCIRNGETLILSCESKEVEEAKDQHDQPIQSKNNYSVFYIDTVGGLYTRQKKLFRNNALKQFKRLCVYGEKGMTVEEALTRDGRFIEDLGNFTLSDNSDPDSITERTQKVDNLHQKEFKICLPKIKRANDEKPQKNLGASKTKQQKCDAVVDALKQSGSVKKPSKQERISVRTAVANCVNTEEVYKKLCEQFPRLKEWMEKRFPGDSYQKALELRKEDFGKIQHSFSEVHRVKKLLELGESVCKVVVRGGEGVRQGTGFVLFDNFILTNAHLFKECVEGQELMEDIHTYVKFNYEEPGFGSGNKHFVKRKLIGYSDGDLDYAILEVNPEAQRKDPTTQTKKRKVPPGLLNRFGDLPLNGEACIIGHPAGEVKKMDPICIIEKEKREQAVNRNLENYKDYLFPLCTINHSIKNDPRADILLTYNTFMYHGSSGSPVFDAGGRVFGLHSGGFFYGSPKSDESVIEYALPLLKIFEHFVSKLKKENREEDKQLLKRVEKKAKGNRYLEYILNLRATSTEEPSAENDETADSDESMETD
ncbi:serine protease FAM111A-like [Centropristis striata]|uniref:serine protease FAM111A-like n=1 Tax=Centropristis striata TaxID=184440 RepID=UPI0027E0164E|nr:serine protease FAM111A-like [Centropristis striata]XP_059210116.1 serine protease FAM111A-like [Centropristis striata]